MGVRVRARAGIPRTSDDRRTVQMSTSNVALSAPPVGRSLSVVSSCQLRLVSPPQQTTMDVTGWKLKACSTVHPASQLTAQQLGRVGRLAAV